ncbi:MAG: DJ-1/PfpI family protein [Bacteroidota bacterium]
MNKSTHTLCFLLFTFMLMAQNSIPITPKYVCPPCNSSCDEKVYDGPGVCPHCNMVFIRKDLSKTIAFYLQNGVEVLDFAGPMEVFAYAGYKVFTVSENQGPIKSQGILTVVPDYSIENAPKADILAFFGGNSTAAFENENVINWVKNQDDIQYYFSVCTGAFVLAEAGILDGKTATTFHNALDSLETKYPKIEVRKDVRFVDNGREITTAGISAGIDGALHLVAKLQGLNAAKRTAYYMEYDNWNIGDGLILSNDTPYIQKISTNQLKAFEGIYEYKQNKQIILQLDKNSSELRAQIDGMTYPIYHEQGDVFSDVGSEPIFFKRDAKNEIIGYVLSESGKLFKKL